MKPLPENYYVARKWLKSMTDYYCTQKHLLPKEVLQKPLDWLCAGIQDIIDLQTQMPDIACGFFKHAINPMLSPQDFLETIYNPILQNAKDLKDARYVHLAVSLLDIRLLFERNSEFIEKYFYEEINKIQIDEDANADTDKKLEKFSEVMQGITHAHVTQVIELIKIDAQIMPEATEIAPEPIVAKAEE